jgi:hypothetical protein
MIAKTAAAMNIIATAYNTELLVILEIISIVPTTPLLVLKPEGLVAWALLPTHRYRLASLLLLTWLQHLFARDTLQQPLCMQGQLLYFQHRDMPDNFYF